MHSQVKSKFAQKKTRKKNKAPERWSPCAGPPSRRRAAVARGWPRLPRFTKLSRSGMAWQAELFEAGLGI